MSDKPWKAFEREIGKLIGGTRFWANSGESVDCEGPLFLAQCKHVKSMSLNAIADLAHEIAEDGRCHRSTGDSSNPIGSPDPKMGILALRTRPGRGKKSKTVIVMTDKVFSALRQQEDASCGGVTRKSYRNF